MGCPSSKEVQTGTKKAIGGNNNKNDKNDVDVIDKTVQATIGSTDSSANDSSSSSINIRYAYMSRRGYYPDDENKANQDSYSITKDFCNNDNNSNSMFFGVYDGHGPEGEHCAQYARDHLPTLICNQMNKPDSNHSDNPAQEGPIKQINKALKKAHIQCNNLMHKEHRFNDIMSGTTSISCFMHTNNSSQQPLISICNVGDSRAIIGSKKKSSGSSVDDDSSSSSLVAVPLSKDQTPYRKDEIERIKKFSDNVRILTAGEITRGVTSDSFKFRKNDNNNEDNTTEDTVIDLGEEIDTNGDPPRIWSKNGDYPGTAFTRSLGDEVADTLGVIGEPEISTIQLTANDKVIILASDGVFEFLTNREVLDICCRYDNPKKSCEAIVDEAYCKWLSNENRSDDVTIICIFIDDIVDNSNSSNLEDNGDDNLLITTVDKLMEEMNNNNNSKHNDNENPDANDDKNNDNEINNDNSSLSDRRKTLLITKSKQQMAANALLKEGIDLEEDE